MFIRRKKNSSGSTSIVILEKRNRKNVVLKIVGTSIDAVEIEHFYNKALKEVQRLQLSNPHPFDQSTELAFADSFTNCIECFSLVGSKLLLGKIFDGIGFDAIGDELFRHLVLTRLDKLEEKIKSGKLSKQHINNKGYNKYLNIVGEATISINKEKYEDDKKWDGLKGYRTNTGLTKDEVIEQYYKLWQIEKAFRISKHDLQICPIYHHLQCWKEAYICIVLAACKIYKELEQQLKE